MKTTHLIVILGFLSAFCCSIASAERQGMRTADVKLVHDFAKKVAIDHHDTCQAMAEFGIDYPVLVQQALDGQPRAIRLLVALPWIARFDGAVATSFGDTRYKVVMQVGDERLVAAFASCKKGFNYDGVRQSLLGFPLASSISAEADEAVLKKRLPNFWKMLTERAEQDGADQRATAPEPKSEGQEKPKLQSEERPR